MPREVRDVPGCYALVGVPCSIKAVQPLRRQDAVLRERIVATLGLFCGHMKSAHMTASFARQMGVPAGDAAAVECRVKDPGRPANWHRTRLVLRNGTASDQDWFDLAEGDCGSGFLQNPACNFCDDVVTETAGIASGDAWVEPDASDPGGTNVVVVRLPLLAAMLQEAVAQGQLALTPVDADFVVRTQVAGFRQRREGLAYRLSWLRPVARLRKRVPARADGLPLRRKLVYRMRAFITAWSAHIYRWAPQPAYLAWSRAVLAAYQALAWSCGRLGAWMDRWLPA